MLDNMLCQPLNVNHGGHLPPVATLIVRQWSLCCCPNPNPYPHSDPDADPNTAQGRLNVYGPGRLALATELALSDAKLALFQTACLNPTVPGAVPWLLSGSG